MLIKYHKLNFTIDSTTANQRLDQALTALEQIQTRSQAAKLIQQNQVTLNGNNVKASHKTQLGDIYDVSIPVHQKPSLEPFDCPLKIVYEDNDLLIVDKPSGLVVHPSVGHEQDTLVNALIHQNIHLSTGSNPLRPGIVHRIDKDTSGLIVVCKTDFAHEKIASQFKEKSIHRIYYALVFGRFKEESGSIESYLIRHPKHRKKFTNEILSSDTLPQGKQALTHFKVLETSEKGISLVQCQLETGRTHQIRVHLSEKLHPIVGDPIYCSKNQIKRIRSNNLKKIIASTDRLCLHASEIGFQHPTQDTFLKFKSPWPQEMVSLLQFLGFSTP